MGWFGFVGIEEGGGEMEGIIGFFFRDPFLWMDRFFFLGVICFEGAHLEGGFD